MTGTLHRLAARARGRRQPERPHDDRPQEQTYEEPQPEQACELCAEPLADVHRHLLELPARELRCACRACQVLFDHGAAGGGHYRLVPERRLRLSGFDLDRPAWARLGAPVRTVFLVQHSDGPPTLYYPSPAGAVRAAVAPSVWEQLCRSDPALDRARPEPDVEALLADRDHGAWIVPVDDCYALVGTVRAHWRGLSGGQDVRDHITRFFTDLRERSATVPAGDDRSPA